MFNPCTTPSCPNDGASSRPVQGGYQSVCPNCGSTGQIAQLPDDSRIAWNTARPIAVQVQPT